VIYRSIYQQVTDQILSGHLPPGARLPSSRNLAAQLGCSRGSVERGCELLLAEGYIVGEGAAGTRVNPNLDPALIATGVIANGVLKFEAKPGGQSILDLPDSQPLPLQIGLPALDAFPRKLCNRLTNKHARSICVSEGIATAPDARFSLVTPTHQSLMGVSLSLVRRMELLHWVASADSWIIEDDSDSEFRYGEKPLPALKSLDANNRVIYTGSFSKVLAPKLMLGYIVVPKQLQAKFEQHFTYLSSAGSQIEQQVIAEFMAQDHFSLHIKKRRKLYAERRAALATTLTKRLPNELSISLQAGGMHLISELLDMHDESLLERKARKQGLAP